MSSIKCEEKIPDTIPYICGGEMEEKGRIPIGRIPIDDEGSLGTISSQTIYQCKSCKDIKIC